MRFSFRVYARSLRRLARGTALALGATVVALAAQATPASAEIINPAQGFPAEAPLMLHNQAADAFAAPAELYAQHGRMVEIVGEDAPQFQDQRLHTWHFERGYGDSYRIRAGESADCLTVDENRVSAPVTLQKCDNAPDQEFAVQRSPQPGAFSLVPQVDRDYALGLFPLDEQREVLRPKEVGGYVAPDQMWHAMSTLD